MIYFLFQFQTSRAMGSFMQKFLVALRRLELQYVHSNSPLINFHCVVLLLSSFPLVIKFAMGEICCRFVIWLLYQGFLMLPWLSLRFSKVFVQQESGNYYFWENKRTLIWMLKCILKFLDILCSSKFRSFSYIYNEDQFIAALADDVIIVKDLPPNLKEARKRKQLPTFRPQHSAPPSFYMTTVLPKLEKAKVIGLIITDGGCLQVPCHSIQYKEVSANFVFLI